MMVGMSDIAPDLLAHSVTADYGPITATDLDESIMCVRVVFHHGGGDTPVHSERFCDPKALPELIANLQAIHEQIKSG